MIATQAKLVYHLNKYYNEKCQSRKAAISKTIREVCKVVSDVLKEVEVQEPRFISSLNEMDNRFEGLEVISPTEFEVVLYLKPDGGLQLRGRRLSAGLRRAQAKRRAEEKHVPLGRVHHGFGIPVRAQDPLQVPDARGAGGG